MAHVWGSQFEELIPADANNLIDIAANVSLLW
jgi:hypothetical protein